jgi:putative aminopeptidase FrvX
VTSRAAGGLLSAALAAILAAGISPAADTPVVPRERIETRLRQADRENAVRRARLDAMFEEAGCGGEHRSSQRVAGAELPNLICSLPGEGKGRIIVGAHFDCVPAGRGVIDNWSGAALLPSLFEALNHGPRRHTFVFVGFTDEEKGLVGSEFYAGHLPAAERESVKAMVNLDSVGLSSTRVWTSHADPKLVDLLKQAAAGIEAPVSDGNVESLGTSDSESFARRRVASITIHSVTSETFSILHSARDDVPAVSLPDYYDTYRLLAAYLELLDAELP